MIIQWECFYLESKEASMPVLDHCVIIVGTSRGERESMSLSFFSLVLWHFAGGGGRGGVAFLHIINAAAQRLGQQLISFSTLSKPALVATSPLTYLLNAAVSLLTNPLRSSLLLQAQSLLLPKVIDLLGL